jgi:hypothetical protein
MMDPTEAGGKQWTAAPHLVFLPAKVVYVNSNGRKGCEKNLLLVFLLCLQKADPGEEGMGQITAHVVLFHLKTT